MSGRRTWKCLSCGEVIEHRDTDCPACGGDTFDEMPAPTEAQPGARPDAEPLRCGIPARTLPPCDLEWGHDGDMHANAGDGFYSREHDEEHHRRQADNRSAAEHWGGGVGPPAPSAPAAASEALWTRCLMPLEGRRACGKSLERWGDRSWRCPEGHYNAPSTLVREHLGRLVREVWVVWALDQENPKPHHCLPWEEISETDREVDRRIGETLVGIRDWRNGQTVPSVVQERRATIESALVREREQAATIATVNATLDSVVRAFYSLTGDTETRDEATLPARIEAWGKAQAAEIARLKQSVKDGEALLRSAVLGASGHTPTEWYALTRERDVAISRAAAAERDAEACRGVLREVTAALCDYVKVNSLEHDDPDCPQDDTCECVVFGRLSRALDASVAALRETT